MATYAIGDVQGCYDELQALLAHIKFDQHNDCLWFVGDLINRGPKSLEVLRFVKGLPNAVLVLGNHELHLFSLVNGHIQKNHTLADILSAPDKDELINWLRVQPLLHYDAKLNYVMTHAGIPPQWNLTLAQQCAHEVETILRSTNYAEFLPHMYGNQPTRWTNDLQGWERLRFISNALTRMRFCTTDGELNFSYDGSPSSAPSGLIPWFKVSQRSNQDLPIIFGHWAALQGKVDVPNVFGLDTGCVYGNYLTAMRLEDHQRFSVPGKK